ncbi:OmpH family outer membrane protein [Candidatus Pelagibacter sp.]|nr:OmpH family outer membrane protein [Candidatus Pelagibacter sp.]
MLKIKILIIFFLLFNFKVYASDSFAIVDIDFLMNNSKAGKYIKKNIKSNSDNIIKEFLSKEKKLREEESKLISQKKILSEEDFKKKATSLNKEILKFTNEKKKAIELSSKKRNKAFNELLNNINSLLVEYAAQKNITLVLDKKNIIMTKNENDITKEIFELLEKKISKININ